MKKQQNVTLSLPEPLLRRFRVYSAVRNQSMSGLMQQAIRNLLNQSRETSASDARFLDRIRKAPDWGTKGVISWTRGDLHER